MSFGHVVNVYVRGLLLILFVICDLIHHLVP